MLVGVAIATPVIAYLIAGLGFGTYTGSAGTVLAFVGVGVLYTLVVALVTRLAPGAPRPVRDLRVARDLRVPQHPEPRRHVHRDGVALLLALPQPLLDRRGRGERRAQHPLLRRVGRGRDILRLLAWTAATVAARRRPARARPSARPPPVARDYSSFWARNIHANCSISDSTFVNRSTVTKSDSNAATVAVDAVEHRVQDGGERRDDRAVERAPRARWRGSELVGLRSSTSSAVGRAAAMSTARTAIRSALSNATLARSSSSGCNPPNLGPTTFQCACLATRPRSSKSTTAPSSAPACSLSEAGHHHVRPP